MTIQELCAALIEYDREKDETEKKKLLDKIIARLTQFNNSP